jgi:hypothetical protein
MPRKQVSGRLPDGDHPGLKAGITDGGGDQLTDGLPPSLAQAAQELTVVEE